MNIRSILIIVSVILFLIAAFTLFDSAGVARIAWGWLGMAVFAVSFVVPNTDVGNLNPTSSTTTTSKNR